VLDMEHTGLEMNDIANQIAWLKATTIAPFVRVPQPLYHFLARTMDAGALGVMAGNVETAEQARSIVQAVKYAPIGNRGVGLGTAHNDYRPPDPVAYFRQSNESSTVICQIESTKGLANVDAIAATEGVDVLWIGHFDLTQSMGIPAQFHHADFLAAVHCVIESAKRYGRRSAIQAGNPTQAAEWLDLGFDVMSYGLDIAVYRDALTAAVNGVRQKIQAP
jgi:2-keto-3-deoxy-L-rhamnonate aldolase RhmA